MARQKPEVQEGCDSGQIQKTKKSIVLGLGMASSVTNVNGKDPDARRSEVKKGFNKG